MLLVYLATQRIFDVIVDNTKDLKKNGQYELKCIFIHIHIDIFKHEIRFGYLSHKSFRFFIENFLKEMLNNGKLCSIVYCNTHY